MRRMISQKLQDFIAKLFGIVDVEDDVVQFGKDIEVDGDIKVNGVENLTDKDGNPLDFGGGGSATIVDTEEIVHIEGEEGTELYLAQEVSNKVQNSLQLPVSPPLADALVGVGTNGAQKQIGVGDGLEVDNGVLKATSIPKITYDAINGKVSDLATQLLPHKNKIVSIDGSPFSLFEIPSGLYAVGSSINARGIFVVNLTSLTITGKMIQISYEAPTDISLNQLTHKQVLFENIQ